MKNSTWVAISCLTGALAVGACSSTGTGGTQGTSDTGTGGQKSSTTSTGTTTTTTTTGTATTTSGTGGGTTGGMVNGCDPTTTTVSTGNVSITFPTAAGPMQYAPACVKVHEGSMVTWTGSFTNHPLVPTAGMGTTPNPITATSTGMTASVTFPAAGSFAYNCSFHPSVMLGAVFVVP